MLTDSDPYGYGDLRSVTKLACSGGHSGSVGGYIGIGRVGDCAPDTCKSLKEAEDHGTHTGAGGWGGASL